MTHRISNFDIAPQLMVRSLALLAGLGLACGTMNLPVMPQDEIPEPDAGPDDPEPSARCDYYAAPDGSSDNLGTSTASPFRVQDFWSVASPGKTLCLLDGEYKGAANMIDPPDNLSGTGSSASWPPADGQKVSGSNPITVRALNDGGAIIDGQFQRAPVVLTGTHWFVLEGFNVRHSSGHLVSIGQPASNIIIRRVVMWDTRATFPEGTGIALTFDAVTNILIEDVGIFGIFGSGVRPQASADGPITFRRVYVDSQGYMGGADTSFNAFHLNYSSTRNVTCENCLGRVSMSQQPFSHCFDAAAGYPSGCVDGYRQSGPGARFVYRIRGGENGELDTNTRLLGSLAFALETDRWRYNGVQVGPQYAIRAPVAQRIDGVHIKNTLVFIHPSNSAFNTTYGFYLRHSSGGNDLVMANTSSVRGSLGDDIEGLTDGSTIKWNVSERAFGTSLAAVPSPWTATTTGANLCFRYVNRAQTTMPLWPWPMNERIKQASILAAAGYTGPCNTCDWSDAGGTQSTPPARAPIDVMAQIQSSLGTIPSQCLNADG